MERFCKNHPEQKAISFCHNCGNYYCAECLHEGNQYYYCIEEDCHKKYIEEVGQQPERIEKKSTKVAGVLITIIVLAFAGTVGKHIANKIFSNETIVSFETADWAKKQLEHTGLYIETPFELSKTTLDLPEDYKSLINEMISYQYTSNSISVNINFVVYAKEIIANLDGAAEGAINNMEGSSGITDFTYYISHTVRNNIEGQIISGYFKIQKQQSEYLGVIFANDSKMWQILCTFLSKDENKIVAERIINSVQITL